MPTIDDDGFVLWESHTIVRYLAAKHGMGALCPAGLEARADAERWMDWAFTFQNAMRAVFWGLIRTPAEKRDHKAIEEGRQQERRAARDPGSGSCGKAYMAGENFTMGDIPLGCEVQRWMRVPIERPSLPNVEAWFERLRERPAFRKCVDIPLT